MGWLDDVFGGLKTQVSSTVSSATQAAGEIFTQRFTAANLPAPNTPTISPAITAVPTAPQILTAPAVSTSSPTPQAPGFPILENITRKAGSSIGGIPIWIIAAAVLLLIFLFMRGK